VVPGTVARGALFPLSLLEMKFVINSKSTYLMIAEIAAADNPLGYIKLPVRP
jgi:hypothetical protein